MNYIRVLILIFTLLSLFGCKPQGNSSEKSKKDDGVTGSSMTLVTPSSSPSSVSAPTIRISGVQSGQTVMLYDDSVCSLVIGSAIASDSTVTLTVAPLTVGTHFFSTRSAGTLGPSTCSGPLLSYNYLGSLPTLGTAMSLVNPVSSPGTISTPTIRISGVVNGETVALYTNSSCTTLVGSAVATNSSVNITTSILSVGTFSFYTKSISASGSTACSSALLTYNYLGIAPTVATSMTLINPSSTPNYISTPTIRLNGMVSGETGYIYTDAICSVLVGSATATGTTVSVTTSTLPVGLAQFYTKSSNSLGASACSASLLSYNYLGVLPTRATSMTLINPVSSPGTVSTPTIRLGGVVSGETINLYSNSSCTVLVGSAVAAGTTVDITSSALSKGTISFYTKTTNTLASTTCSGVLLSYNYLGPLPTMATSMSLQNPSSSPNTISTPTIRLSGVVAGETVGLYSNATCTSSLGSSVALGTTVDIITSALSVGVTNFYTKTSNAAGATACSGLLFSYNFLGALPTLASAMYLDNPLASPNYLSTPTVRLTGVAIGDTVELFSDNACTSSLGSAVALSTSVSIVTSVLPLGVTSFYTKSTNAVGSTACSGSMLSYNYYGASPNIQISWTANREKAVNQAGGGYRVYYSRTSGFSIATASYLNVPYVSGGTAPVSTIFTNLMKGNYYFKVVAYSALNPAGGSSGSVSSPSTELSFTVP